MAVYSADSSAADGAPAGSSERRRAMRRIVTAVLGAVLLGAPPHTRAATFTVNSDADTTDGACTPDAGGCTLREAIEAAVATAGRDTILFDAAVFPRGANRRPIAAASPLPIIADPAGTVVDGGDSHVRINAASGLVFASASGVPLTKVTVANLIVSGASGPGVLVCGGMPPLCDDEVSGALVRNVVANQTDDGIVILARVNKKSRVLDSVVFHCRETGILIAGLESVTGARVQGSTVRDCSDTGIMIGTLGDNVGSTVLDSIATENTGYGLQIFGYTLAKTKLANVVADENVGPGIVVGAFTDAAGVAMTNTVGSHNDGAGIQTYAGDNATGVTLKNVVADANTGHGISLEGGSAGAAITRANVGGNTASGLVVGDQGAAVGAKVSRIISAGNGVSGVVLTARGSALQQVHASANGFDGIVVGAPGSGGNTIETTATAANWRGIVVDAGSSGNSIQGNGARGNAAADLVDENPGCAGNAWTENVFFSGSEACVH